MMRSWIHFTRGRFVRQARVGLGELREEHLSRHGFQGPVAMIYRTEGPSEAPIVKIYGSDGNVLTATKLAYKNKAWQLTTPFGATLPFAEGTIAKLDFNLGRLVRRFILLGKSEAEGVFTLFAIAFVVMGALMAGLGIVGEYIGRIISKFGYVPVRGSSSRGGARALLQSRRVLEKGLTVAFTTDGPRGPALVAKPGPITLARSSGVPIVNLVRLEKPSEHRSYTVRSERDALLLCRDQHFTDQR